LRTLKSFCSSKGPLAFVLLVLVCTPVAIGQVGNPPNAGDSTEILVKPGVVVEKVDKIGGAAKAGIREGDLLLHWSQGSAKGDFDPLFGLESLQKEEGRVAPVTLTGLRAGQETTWNMSDIELAWGIHCGSRNAGVHLTIGRLSRSKVNGSEQMEIVSTVAEARFGL
jgi:hypothetical protein